MAGSEGKEKCVICTSRQCDGGQNRVLASTSILLLYISITEYQGWESLGLLVAVDHLFLSPGVLESAPIVCAWYLLAGWGPALLVLLTSVALPQLLNGMRSSLMLFFVPHLDPGHHSFWTPWLLLLGHLTTCHNRPEPTAFQLNQLPYLFWELRSAWKINCDFFLTRLGHWIYLGVTITQIGSWGLQTPYSTAPVKEQALPLTYSAWAPHCSEKPREYRSSHICHFGLLYPATTPQEEEKQVWNIWSLCCGPPLHYFRYIIFYGLIH